MTPPFTIHAEQLQLAIIRDPLRVPVGTTVDNVAFMMAQMCSACNLIRSGMCYQNHCFADLRSSCILITATDSHHVLGFITEREIIHCYAQGSIDKIPVEQIMISPSIVPQDQLPERIRQQSLSYPVVVVDNQDHIQGLITHASLFQALSPTEFYRINNQRLEQQKLLANLTQQIRSSLEISTILNTIVNELRQVLNCERVNIWQFSGNFDRIQVVAESTTSALSLLGVEVEDSCFKNRPSEAYQQGKVRVVPDIYRQNLSLCHLEMLERLQTRSKILVPIFLNDALWGLLNVCEGQYPRDWYPQEVELLELLSKQISIALQQAHIYYQLQCESQERQQVAQELRELNLQLEAKVSERTADLQEAEAKYRKIYENAVEGIYQSNLKGKILMANVTLAYLFGYDSPDHLIHEIDHLQKQCFVNPSESDRFWSTLLDQGFITDFEVEIYRRDGSKMWISESGRLVRDDSKNSVYYEGIISDITDRKQIELELHKSESRYRAIFNQAAVGINQANYQGQFIGVNQAFCEMLGYTEAELLQLQYQDLTHPEDLEIHHRECKALLEGTISSYSHEKRYRHKAGHYIWTETTLSALRDNQGNFISDLAIVLDISDRKAIEKQLLKQQSMLESMSQLGEIGAWEIDLIQQESYWSPITKAIYEVPENYQPRLEDHLKFYKPQYREQIELALKEGIEDGIPWHMEVELVTAKGREIWIACVGKSEVKDGVCQRLFGSIQDISGRKYVEQQLIKAKQDADAAAAVKANFLATMSHEIRTPMNGVIGMLNLLKRTSLNEVQQWQTQVALSSAESLLDLINDILDFSKVEAGKMVLEEMDFNLTDYLAECLHPLALKAHEKNLELVVDCREIPLDQTWVKGDPGRLRQILNNLLSNAIKFTEQGEVLVQCALENSPQGLIFRGIIQDTGIGIPEDKLDTLFQSFTQVNASTSRHYGGTGLGLAICKKLCQLMGGTIAVSSEYGKGTRFEFTLRLQPGQSHKDIPRLPQIRDLRDLQGLNILVVDDNATNRAVLAGQLTLWGANSIARADAVSALECCEAQDPPFDLALLDMKMPEMDGIELCRRFKAHPWCQTMPLVMMTSMGWYEEAQNFADLGFSAYLVKPILPSDLLTALLMVRQGGESLQQSGSILTQHYIHSFQFATEAEEPVSRPWLEGVRLLLVEDSMVNQSVALGLLKELGLTAVDVAFDGREALTILRRSPQRYTLILMDCQMPEMDGYSATRLSS